MLRTVFQQLVLFLLPIAAYVAYALWTRRRARRTGGEAVSLEQGPWFWLVAGGLVLSIAGFALLASFKASPSSHYVPAHMENGRVVPGELK